MTTQSNDLAPLSIKEKAAIAKHASDILCAITDGQPITDFTIRGHRTKCETAIELAELFHQILKERGYDGGDRVNE